MEILTCQICGFGGKSLISHVIRKHKITCEEYKAKFNVTKLHILPPNFANNVSTALKLLYKDNSELKQKMSDIQKNGASQFTKKFWTNKGFTDEDAIIKISKIQTKNAIKNSKTGKTRENSCFCVEFWIKKGKSLEEAIEIIRLNQSILSSRSKKFAGKVRTDESKLKISHSMKKKVNEVGWSKHFGAFNGRSKAEIEFYEYIKNFIDPSVCANKVIGNYIVDVITNKKILEFYGDYWHCNPKKYNQLIEKSKYTNEQINKIWEKDKIRELKLISDGYDVLIIWENDWNLKRNECILQIEKYLKTK
jgi:hypothetical protein